MLGIFLCLVGSLTLIIFIIWYHSGWSFIVICFYFVSNKFDFNQTELPFTQPVKSCICNVNNFQAIFSHDLVTKSDLPDRVTLPQWTSFYGVT